MNAAELENEMDAFRSVLEQADLTYQAGLSAIERGEGKGRIVATNSRRLLGSAFIDEDRKGAEPNASRWDYTVGYLRARTTIAFFVEVHSAITSQVTKVEAKLRWLEAFLERPPCADLAELPRQVHWVASGHVKIPRHTRQYKQLQKLRANRGLRGPSERLELE